MGHLVGIVRLGGIALVVFVGLILALFVGLMPNPVFTAIARSWYRSIIFCMGIQCRYEGETIDQTVLLVCNHISWADILIIGARWPFVFLSMQAVATWPIVGWLARQAGTLFIARGSGAASAVLQVAAVLSSGRSVVLFPEGKTSAGVEVKKFHPRIFQAAIDAEVPVQALGISYYDADKPRSAGSRITFVQGGFFTSIWHAVSGPAITAEIAVFPPRPQVEDRQLVAQACQQEVAGHVDRVLHDMAM